MGFVRLPTLHSYWMIASLFHGNWARAIIPTRKRFYSLLPFLHLVDHTAENPADRHRKVRPLTEYLDHRFQLHYQPHQKVSVDERMVKFKGRFAFKQYIQIEPVKWGGKVYAAVDATTSYRRLRWPLYIVTYCILCIAMPTQVSFSILQLVIIFTLEQLLFDSSLK